MDDKDKPKFEELVKELDELEIKIQRLRAEKLVDMSFCEVFDKLAELEQLYVRHRQLSEKIKSIKRLFGNENI